MNYKRAKEVLAYDPETGDLSWAKNRGKSYKFGEKAGCLHGATGYVIVETGGKKYKAHRMAFLLMEGYIPEHQIDHLNGIRDDNRWCNLRHVTSSCNLQNQKIYKNNRTGIPGVGNHHGRFRARGRIGGVLKNLGHYPTMLEAALARYTWEENCSEWKCNKRSELTESIKTMWPEFNPNGETKCLRTTIQ